MTAWASSLCISSTVPVAVRGPCQLVCSHLCCAEASAKGPQAWDSLLASVRQTQPAETWADVQPAFYLLFWSLTFADLHYPAAMYDPS